MNYDEPGRQEIAELARLVPAPAGRDLPAGRHQALKDHLMRELATAGSPASKPALPRRRTPAIATAVAGVAALAAAAAAVALLPGHIMGSSAVLPENTSGSAPAVVRLLDKIATAAARQPSPRVHNSQFWYIKSWVAYQSCIGASGKCVLEKPHERQVWLSVSNLCVTGLLIEDGGRTPLSVFPTDGATGKVIKPTRGSHELVPAFTCPYGGGVNDPTYRFMQSLPTNPGALFHLIKRHMQGQLPRPEEAFTTIGDLLREAIAPPAVSAAAYRAAAMIPGVTLVPNATDAIGRHGVAVAMTFRGVRTEWIFSRHTLQYLGERDIAIAGGSTAGEAAIVQRAFVNHAGQLPG